MRLVLDTNIIVSALLWFGSPRKLLQLFFNADILLFTSQPILDELRDVLSRPKLRRQISRQPLSVDQLVERYSLLAIMVQPQPIPRTAPDPDDDIILATAIAAQADYLVTGDKPLLSLGSHAGFEIVTVPHFLARFPAAPAR